MPVPVLMPTFGQTEGEAVIIRWLKAIGEFVKADEPLLEVESEKAALEVPAPVEGVLLRIVAEAGQTVPYKGQIAWLGQPEDILPLSNNEGLAAAEINKAQPDSSTTDQPLQDGWIKASPLARRIARQKGVDLSSLKGSGPGGRILEYDVEEAATAPRNSKPNLSAIPMQTLNPVAAHDEPTSARAVPLTTANRIMADRMTESYRSAPHFYLQTEVRASRLVELREELLPEVEKATGVRLSFTDLFLCALAKLLPRHPLLNASWQDESVYALSAVNLGIATTTQRGLLVPVMHNAETLSLSQISRQRNYLADQARSGKLKVDELTGGTFTLTNLGMFGIDSFIPILNPPQSAILATGAIAERAVGVSGQLVLQPTLNLTLAVDHRVADGAQAAQFLRELRELLEAPARLLY